MQALLEKNSKLEAAIGAGDRCQQERSQQLSTALSTISCLKQQLKSKQAEANAAQRILKAEKTSRAALMRELRQCNDELAFSQADLTDLRQELRVTQVAAAAESASLRQELKVVRDAVASDAVLHSTESASLKEELQSVKSQNCDVVERNSELQSKLDSALAELDAFKTKAEPAKVRKMAMLFTARQRCVIHDSKMMHGSCKSFNAMDCNICNIPCR